MKLPAPKLRQFAPPKDGFNPSRRTYGAAKISKPTEPPVIKQSRAALTRRLGVLPRTSRG